MKELLMKRKTQFILYFIACFFPVVSDLLRNYLTSLFFGAIEINTKSNFYNVLIFAGFVIVAQFVLYITSRMMRIRYMQHTILDVRIAAFDKIINSSFKHFNKQSKDVYISNLINDVNSFERNFFINLLNFIYSTALYIVSAIIMAWIDVYLMLILVGVSIITFFLSKALSSKTEKLQTDVSTTSEQLTLNVANTLNGLEILKINNIEDKFLNNNIATIQKSEKSKHGFRLFSEFQFSLTNLISTATVLGVMIYLLYQGGRSYQEISLVVIFSSNMVFSLQNIFPRLNVIKSSATIYNKIAKIDEESIEEIKQNPFTFQDKIAFKNVSFSYGNKDVFEDVSFSIEKGKKYIIKGESGAGKSTLLKLISQVFDEYVGLITVDGVDLRTINAKSFSDQVAFIYQDVFLFEDSLKNNISLYKPLSDQVIEEAIKQSGLSDFLKTKEDGLDTMLSENGKNLSGGERQRISIARAIAKKSKILFIDEGTSALNAELGKEIEQAFLNLDSTVLSISHRYYSGVTNHYDYVIEIKNKKVNIYPAFEYFMEEEQHD